MDLIALDHANITLDIVHLYELLDSITPNDPSIQQHVTLLPSLLL